MTKKIGREQLKRIKLELYDLIGMLSIEELITNRRLTKRYEQLHLELTGAY